MYFIQKVFSKKDDLKKFCCERVLEKLGKIDLEVGRKTSGKNTWVSFWFCFNFEELFAI